MHRVIDRWFTFVLGCAIGSLFGFYGALMVLIGVCDAGQ